MPLLTPAEAAAYLKIGEDTLADMRKAGDIPYVNVGRGLVRATHRYEVADLDAWILENKRQDRPQSAQSLPRRRTRKPQDSVIAEFEAAKRRRLKRGGQSD